MSQAWFDPAGLRLIRLILSAEGSRIGYDIILSDYQEDPSPLDWPRHVMIQISSGSRMELRMKSVTVNPKTEIEPFDFEGLKDSLAPPFEETESSSTNPELVKIREQLEWFSEEAGVTSGESFPTGNADTGVCLAEVAVPLPVTGTFHYRIPSHLPANDLPGRRVLVPFGSRQVTGYVLDQSPLTPDFELRDKLKEIVAFLDDEPLFGSSMVPFFRFVSRYYHYPIGTGDRRSPARGLAGDEPENGVSDPGRSPDSAGRNFETGDGPLAGTFGSPSGNHAVTPGAREGLIAPDPMVSKPWLGFGGNGASVRIGCGPKPGVGLCPVGSNVKPDDSDVRIGFARSGTDGPVGRERARYSWTTFVRGFPAWRPWSVAWKKRGRLRIESRTVYRDALGRALTFNDRPPQPTGEQRAARDALLEALASRRFRPYVLYGVTGSGKTEGLSGGGGTGFGSRTLGPLPCTGNRPDAGPWRDC